MMDFDILREILVPVVTCWGGWFFARKKYDAEVDNQKIENVSKAIIVYQLSLDDLGQRLENSNKEKRRLEQEVAQYRKEAFQSRKEIAELRGLVLNLTILMHPKNICLDPTCLKRIKIEEEKISDTELNDENNIEVGL